MLYQFHELQRAIMTPLSTWASSAAQLYTNPYSPMAYTPLSKQIAAALDLTHRLGKAYDKPAWGLQTIETPQGPVEVTEQVSDHTAFCRLIHFSRSPAQGSLPKVLLVAPLSGHHATLLRDTARTLLQEHEVYVTDWIDARTVPLSEGTFGLDDYVHTVQRFLRHLGPGTHVVSVCQPTVPVLAAVSLMAAADDPATPLTMTMMGGPIDARKSPTAVNNLATQHNLSWFERNVIHTVPERYAGYMRRVYPGFLQYAGFVSMNPDRHLNSHRDYFNHLIQGDDESAAAHREFYNEYNAVLDLDAEFYLQTIDVVFQRHLLPRGLWDVGGERVRPEAIRKTALLTIEGELDDISGKGQTSAAIAICSGIPTTQKAHFEVPGAGHYGIFSGRRWRQIVAPRIAQMIREHS